LSYQALARKYRPQTFSDLTGQEHITRTLSHALDRQRLHHAYLFSGIRGTGKTTTARILAKGLNCHQGITSRPCLQCPSCLEIAAGNSIDVLEIDAASNTGVENVRDVIINNIAMAPARDRHKVFVIDEVHMLSTSAFNALLKTLEEPPPHVIFIMATTELHKVPDTILSRCQQFEFRQIPTEQIYQRLREIAGIEGIKIDDQALREVSRAGAGSLRDAQSAFDQVIAFSGAEITAEDVAVALGMVPAATLGLFAEAIARQDSQKMLALVEDVYSRGYDLRNFTRELMAYMRHLLFVKSGIDRSEVLGVADIEIENLKRLAEHYSEEDLVRCFNLLANTEKEIKDSPHPRFQLEIGLVKLTHNLRLRSLDELIERLIALESRITGIPNHSGKPHELEEPHQNPPVSPAPFREPEVDPPARRTPVREPEQTSGESINHGNEVEAILNELQRLNRPLVLTALEEASQIEYRNGVLIATFIRENILMRRVSDSSTLFREIGEKLFGQPMRIEVRTSGQAEEQIDDAELNRRRLHERAMKNPAARLLIEQTRGEIVWVKEKQ